ncbi:MAG TPA: hypothetical protein DD979_15950 [Gammaproteobacteria bacterium]|nr:hypothetical protein [Gammaproteobacteria bacterium]
MEPQWIAAYLALGGVVGFFAGLLGVGGGGIMVPMLTTFFVIQDFGGDRHTVHMALSTSMASIIVTSISSLRAHHRHGAVLWPSVRTLTPAILIGAFGATFVAAMASSKALAVFFVCFMSVVSVQMLLNAKPKPHRDLPGRVGLSLAGLVIGIISSLVAIGGATLTVPFLTWCNVRIQHAIGTAAALGFPIAIAGTLGYFLSGLNAQGMPPGSIGYIYLPAVVLISSSSYFTAPMGARLAHSLPVATLKKVFAGLIVLLCIRMLQSIF